MCSEDDRILEQALCKGLKGTRAPKQQDPRPNLPQHCTVRANKDPDCNQVCAECVSKYEEVALRWLCMHNIVGESYKSM